MCAEFGILQGNPFSLTRLDHNTVDSTIIYKASS